MAIQANPLLTPGPQSGPNSGPAAQFVQNILALQLVHVVGGLNKIDEKMDILIEFAKEISMGIGTLEDQGKRGGGDSEGGNGPGIGEIAIGSAIGGVVSSVVTSLASKLFGAVTGVFTTLAGSITKYLTPVALVSSAIQSNSSGYSTMGKAFQVLGTSMGMVLLPAFALVGATAVTVADKIANELLPVLGDWIELILTKGLSAIDYFVAEIQAAADTLAILEDAVNNFSQWVENKTGMKVESGAEVFQLIYDKMNEDEKEAAKTVGFALNPLAGIYQQKLNERLAEREKYNRGESNDFKQGEDGVFRRQQTTREGILTNLRGFAEEMRRSLGGNSQSVGLSDLGRQIQQAALNQTPFETKILDWAMKSVAELEKITAKLDKPVGH